MKTILTKSNFSKKNRIYEALIAMQTFIIILEEIAKIEDIVNRNEDLVSIISVLQDITQKMLEFRCES